MTDITGEEKKGEPKEIKETKEIKENTLFQLFQKQKQKPVPLSRENDMVVRPGKPVFDSLKKHGLLKLPDKSGWSHYTGTFWSTKYTKALSRGNVYVQLPDDISSITVQAQIQYKGLYRLNSVEKVDIALSDDKTSAVSEFETKPTKVHGVDAPHGKGKLEFKIETRDDTHIRGSYTLSNPEDTGKFELEKGLDHGGQCVIS